MKAYWDEVWKWATTWEVTNTVKVTDERYQLYAGLMKEETSDDSMVKAYREYIRYATNAVRIEQASELVRRVYRLRGGEWLDGLSWYESVKSMDGIGEYFTHDSKVVMRLQDNLMTEMMSLQQEMGKLSERIGLLENYRVWLEAEEAKKGRTIRDYGWLVNSYHTNMVSNVGAAGEEDYSVTNLRLMYKGDKEQNAEYDREVRKKLLREELADMLGQVVWYGVTNDTEITNTLRQMGDTRVEIQESTGELMGRVNGLQMGMEENLGTLEVYRVFKEQYAGKLNEAQKATEVAWSNYQVWQTSNEVLLSVYSSNLGVYSSYVSQYYEAMAAVKKKKAERDAADLAYRKVLAVYNWASTPYVVDTVTNASESVEVKLVTNTVDAREEYSRMSAKYSNVLVAYHEALSNRLQEIAKWEEMKKKREDYYEEYRERASILSAIEVQKRESELVRQEYDKKLHELTNKLTAYIGEYEESLIELAWRMTKDNYSVVDRTKEILRNVQGYVNDAGKVLRYVRSQNLNPVVEKQILKAFGIFTEAEAEEKRKGYTNSVRTNVYSFSMGETMTSKQEITTTWYRVDKLSDGYGVIVREWHTVVIENKYCTSYTNSQYSYMQLISSETNSGGGNQILERKVRASSEKVEIGLLFNGTYTMVQGNSGISWVDAAANLIGAENRHKTTDEVGMNAINTTWEIAIWASGWAAACLFLNSVANWAAIIAWGTHWYVSSDAKNQMSDAFRKLQGQERIYWGEQDKEKDIRQRYRAFDTALEAYYRYCEVVVQETNVGTWLSVETKDGVTNAKLTLDGWKAMLVNMTKTKMWQYVSNIQLDDEMKSYLDRFGGDVVVYGEYLNTKTGKKENAYRVNMEKFFTALRRAYDERCKEIRDDLRKSLGDEKLIRQVEAEASVGTISWMRLQGLSWMKTEGYRQSMGDMLGVASEGYQRTKDQESQMQQHLWNLENMDVELERQRWIDWTTTVKARGELNWDRSLRQYLNKWEDWRRGYQTNWQAGEEAWNSMWSNVIVAKEEWVSNVTENIRLGAVSNVENLLAGELAKQIETLQQNLETLKGSNFFTTSTEDLKAQIVEMQSNVIAENNHTYDSYFARMMERVRLTSTAYVVETLSAARTKDVQLDSEFRQKVKGYEEVATEVSIERFRDMIEKTAEELNNVLREQDEAMEKNMDSILLGSGFLREGEYYVRRNITIDSTLFGGDKREDQFVHVYWRYTDYAPNRISWNEDEFMGNMGNLQDLNQRFFAIKAMAEMASAHMQNQLESNITRLISNHVGTESYKTPDGQDPPKNFKDHPGEIGKGIARETAKPTTVGGGYGHGELYRLTEALTIMEVRKSIGESKAKQFFWNKGLFDTDENNDGEGDNVFVSFVGNMSLYNLTKIAIMVGATVMTGGAATPGLAMALSVGFGAADMANSTLNLTVGNITWEQWRQQMWYAGIDMAVGFIMPTGTGVADKFARATINGMADTTKALIGTAMSPGGINGEKLGKEIGAIWLTSYANAGIDAFVPGDTVAWRGLQEGLRWGVDVVGEAIRYDWEKGLPEKFWQRATYLAMDHTLNWIGNELTRDYVAGGKNDSEKKARQFLAYMGQKTMKAGVYGIMQGLGQMDNDIGRWLNGAVGGQNILDLIGGISFTMGSWDGQNAEGSNMTLMSYGIRIDGSGIQATTAYGREAGDVRLDGDVLKGMDQAFTALQNHINYMVTYSPLNPWGKQSPEEQAKELLKSLEGVNFTDDQWKRIVKKMEGIGDTSLSPEERERRLTEFRQEVDIAKAESQKRGEAQQTIEQMKKIPEEKLRVAISFSSVLTQLAQELNINVSIINADMMVVLLGYAEKKGMLAEVSQELSKVVENSETTYIVKKGDTVESIARKNNMTVEQLLELNPQLCGRIHYIEIGEGINLDPSKTHLFARSATAEEKAKSRRIEERYKAAQERQRVAKQGGRQDGMTIGLFPVYWNATYEDVAMAGAYFAMTGDAEFAGIGNDGRSLSISDLLGKNNTEKFAKKFFEYYSPKVEQWKKWAKEGRVEKFTEKEKNEIKLFYMMLAIGGKFGLGYPEAGNLLLNYLKGNEAKGIEGTPPYIISPEIYKKSVIVQHAMSIMKQYIFKDLQDGVLSRESWSSVGLLKPIKGRDERTQGNFTKRGYLISEQMNQRLQKMNNVFPLVVNVRVLNENTVELEWIVEDNYFFRSYREDPHMYTEFEIGDYKLDDGLGQFLEELGIARSFWYKATWKEVWKWRQR